MRKWFFIGLVAAGATVAMAGADDLPALNVDYMLRGYCFAGSRPDEKAPGGFGRSENLPRRAGAGGAIGAPQAVSLVALPDQSARFAKKYRGLRLILINRTAREVAFSASDSRLPLVLEARDADGAWKPIEYLPSSWCGNSRHRVFLPAAHYWEFVAPVYAGTIATRLRFVLRGEKPIVSNEFAGQVNPAQFTVKQGHTPSDLMDPYED